MSRNGRSKLKILLLVYWVGMTLAPRLCHAQATESFLLPDQRTNSTHVVVIQDSLATELFQPRIDRVRNMITRGLTRLTGKSSASNAWRSLLSPRDIVGLKVFCGPGSTSGTRPAVVAAVIESMIDAGISTNRIVLWDKRLADLRNSGMTDLGARFGIPVEACESAGYDSKVFYESQFLGHLFWGDLEFGKDTENIGRKSFVSKLVTSRITKIVNITPLLNHHAAGVCGSLYSLAVGSVDNTFRFEPDPNRLATAVPEIFALPALGDHVVLNIVDALICQYQGEQTSLLHYSTTLNEIRMSRDPVALDVLSVQELEKQRKIAGMYTRTNSMELFQNAALLELGTADPQTIRVELLH